MSTNATIYTGLWTDWSQGQVWGATLTLSSRDGAILISFIAVLLSLTATQLWRTLSYIYHQIRYRTGCADGLEHQQRVIVRNAATPGSAAFSLLLQCFSWRRPGRTLPLATVTLLYLILVTAVSIIVPSHLSAGSARLLIPINCGYWFPSDDYEYDSGTAKAAQAASLYSQNCYETDNPKGCDALPIIDTIFTTNVSCPFEDKMCYVKNGSVPISMTTRLIDSRKDLGINTKDRLTLRPQMTCSILSVANYTNSHPHPDIPSAAIINFNLGPAFSENYTHSYNNYSMVLNLPYSLLSKYATPGRNNVWTPIPELNRTDAHVTAIFFSVNGVVTEKPIDDPMFSSHNPIQLKSFSVYGGDYYVTVIGCIRQYQVCNPDNAICTELLAETQTFTKKSLESLQLSDTQRSIAQRIQYGLVTSDLLDTITSLSDMALRASSTVDATIQISRLPNTQYQREIFSWFTTSLALLQSTVQSYATSETPNPDFNPTPIESQMCTAQRTGLTSNTTSFSLAKLLIVTLLCALTILLSITLEPVVGVLQSRLRLGTGTHGALWKLDENLQLQRALFEALGYTPWSSKSSFVPTMRDSDGDGDGDSGASSKSRSKFGAVDSTTDPRNPRMLRSDEVDEYQQEQNRQNQHRRRRRQQQQQQRGGVTRRHRHDDEKESAAVGKVSEVSNLMQSHRQSDSTGGYSNNGGSDRGREPSWQFTATTTTTPITTEPYYDNREIPYRGNVYHQYGDTPFPPQQR